MSTACKRRLVFENLERKLRPELAVGAVQARGCNEVRPAECYLRGEKTDPRLEPEVNCSRPRSRQLAAQHADSGTETLELDRPGPSNSFSPVLLLRFLLVLAVGLAAPPSRWLRLFGYARQLKNSAAPPRIEEALRGFFACSV